MHLAWHADPLDYLLSGENVASANYAIDVATAAAKLGIPFLGAGTCAEYGSSNTDLLETDPTNPGSVYAREKLRALETTREICGESGSTWVWSRIFYPFGPAEHPARLVPQVVRGLANNEGVSLGPCNQIRDQIDVRDVAEAFALLATRSINDRSVEGIFNVSIGSAVPLRNWLTSLAGDQRSLLHFADPLAPPATNAGAEEAPARVVGNSKRLRSLGWIPKQPSPPHWSSLVS